MINLSVDTRNLSSSSDKKHLEIVLSEMIYLAEYEFELSVEEIGGPLSFWVPTSDDEVEEMEEDEEEDEEVQPSLAYMLSNCSPRPLP